MSDTLSTSEQNLKQRKVDIIETYIVAWNTESAYVPAYLLAEELYNALEGIEQPAICSYYQIPEG